MTVKTDELLRLLRGACRYAFAIDQRELSTIINTVEHGRVEGRLDSSSSIFLAQLLASHESYLTADAFSQLSSTEIYGLSVNSVNATAYQVNNRRQIFVFDGMQQAIYFYGSLIHVIELLRRRHPNYTLTIGGIDRSAAEMASMAGLVMLADFLITGRSLQTLADMLGPDVRKNIKYGYYGAVIFVLLHELGHLMLGHTVLPIKSSNHTSRHEAVEGALSIQQSEELDADAFAIRCLKAEVREHWVPNVIFFLGALSFIEYFYRPPDADHPLSVNRLNNILEESGVDGERLVEPRRMVNEQIAALERQNRHGEDTRYKIFETMSIDVAAKIFKTIRRDMEINNMKL